MLTRLKVSGFKNLLNVDVRFGPFTCVAGPNGVGKSNLFDAIQFLSALADHPLIEAALSVRGESSRTGDVRSLFYRVGDTYVDQMTFEVEMIVPHEAWDDLGQKAEASITFLHYALTLGYREDDSRLSRGSLELLQEELVHINRGDASKHLLFPHSAAQWRKSAVRGQHRVPYFISTAEEGAHRVIKLHQDGGSSGRPLSRHAVDLPRTVLSATNAAESPTALVARREMQSWRLLQLEPSALRQPNTFTDPIHLGINGSYLASTLYHLARSYTRRYTNGQSYEADANMTQVYSQVANCLAELIDDVHALWIERDDRRELLTLYVKNRDGTPHPGRALSDGTLRFLALAVLELDPEAQGLLCLEEPENGIHPPRIPAMLQLLQNIATDVSAPVGMDNPLRQVIVNTHSPAVVSQVPDDSLLVAETQETLYDGRRCKRVCFSYLSDTWRAKTPQEEPRIVPKGKLLDYLNPVVSTEVEAGEEGLWSQKPSSSKIRRVIDRPDVLQLLLPFAEQGA